MHIYFYLENEEETGITSFHNLVSNPFKVGDEISLEVDELSPKDLSTFREELRIGYTTDNNNLSKKFRLKTIRIVRERKFMRFNLLHEPKLTIEYHCELID